ncbi:MAG: RNA 2',3'-cyclic phosphodiesterase [Actinobacteria bacterium]|nr:RNA 2',3'-cyclic phosphodiesterase [Actinomycetota bacterium]
MGERLFAAVVPPGDVIDELAAWVDPRRDDAWRWTHAPEWHLTLAFYGDVDTWRYEALVERLEAVVGGTAAFPLKLHGVGCFASVEKANVLFADVDDPTESLAPLAAACRTAATTIGIDVARQRYRPHLTLGRRNRPSDASRYLRALAELETRSWQVTDAVLVQSFLGQGPRGTARHEVRERFSVANG